MVLYWSNPTHWTDRFLFPVHGILWRQLYFHQRSCSDSSPMVYHTPGIL